MSSWGYQNNNVDGEAEFEADDVECPSMLELYAYQPTTPNQLHTLSVHSATSGYVECDSTYPPPRTVGYDPMVTTGSLRSSNESHVTYVQTDPPGYHNDLVSGDRQFHGRGDHNSYTAGVRSRQDYPGEEEMTPQPPGRTTTWGSDSSMEANQGSVNGDSEGTRRVSRPRDSSEQQDAIARYEMPPPVGSRYVFAANPTPVDSGYAFAEEPAPVDSGYAFAEEPTPVDNGYAFAEEPARETSTKKKNKQKSKDKPDRTFASSSASSSRRHHRR